jgi:hypothetical protein
MVLCNAFGDRLGGLSDIGKPIWLLRDVCEWAAKTYKPLQVDWDWSSIERLIRARVHAVETIGASNSLAYIWEKFDPVPIIAGAPEPDEEIRERSAFQLNRLEAAERLTREGGQRRAFFGPKDVELLAALALVAGRTSTNHTQILADQAIVGEERRRLVERHSPEWRDLFDTLFELKPAAVNKGRDSHEQAILDLPEFQKLAVSSPKVRGIALAEASAIHVYLEQLRAGKAVLPSGATIKDGIGEIAHPCFFLPAMAGMLLEAGAVECDDNTMAALVDRASGWRALCHPHLLDSAEHTLSAGPAVATVAALRRLAALPSHCFVPSRPSGDYEGDAWWQDTPGRIATMLAPYRDTIGTTNRPIFGRKIFGRKER